MNKSTVCALCDETPTLFSGAFGNDAWIGWCTRAHQNAWLNGERRPGHCVHGVMFGEHCVNCEGRLAVQHQSETPGSHQ